MKTASGQTVVDGLKNVFSDIGGLMLLPDSAAHMQFLTQLQQVVQGYVQQKLQQATGMAQQHMQQAAGMQGSPPPAQNNAGMGGANPGFNTSSPDELRRVLGATAPSNAGQVS